MAELPVKGTTPAGAATEEQASLWVRRMFGEIAPRYDRLNTILSFHIDAYWRRRMVKRVADILGRPDARVLDLCCGTAPLLIALERARGAAVLGSDFCHPMLTEARQRLSASSLHSELFEADALRLPIADASLDLITVAFGFRNFANYHKGVLELRRVLKPGGLLAVLEFSKPPNRAFAALYGWYSRRILPLIGGALSGCSVAYEYLPESVRKFPDAPGLAEEMRNGGFSSVEYELMTGGIVALHLARV